MAFPIIDISREDGEKREGCFCRLHPERDGKGAAEIGRPVSLQRKLASWRKLGGRSSLIGGKQGGGYGSAMGMAAAALGVVE